tara:strand:- start:10978 stop:11193 length:216 start_codon:yes stop_codon:yes gene_type:complete
MKTYFTNEIEKEENGIKLDRKKTDLRKEAFIQEIRNGLGEQIKANPNKIKIKTKPKENIIKKIFKKIIQIF